MPVISNIAIPLDYTEEVLKSAAAKKLRIREKDIVSLKILKRSVDARDKGSVHFVFSLDVTQRGEARENIASTEILPEVRAPYRPVVVGLGPAGLFAAWYLAKRGMKPIVLERGKDVVRREEDTKRFSLTGVLDTESNIQFGEGGAGAFSDGKLVTGISDARIRQVLETLYECGAPEEILYEAKPHIGTDRLPGVVKALREKIEALGGTMLFEQKLTGIHIENNRVTGVMYQNRDGQSATIETRDVVLAIGHSARDTFRMLRALGLPMQAKPFSIGARIEHLQKDINRAQYGAFANHPALGASDYKLNARLKDGRGAYTFCMCPGGTVIAAASQEGRVVTNGMSTYKRDGVNANSALLIGIDPSDFGGEEDPLAGIAFQEKWEKAAFEAGEGGYRAPAQRVEDLLANRKSKNCGSVKPTYRPGVTYTSLAQCLPDFVYRDLGEAVQAFDRRLHGFAAPDALLTGVETRSSSPVRLLRNENCMSAVEGLFPAGEGAGYAGGITSAAVDGLRCAEKLAARYEENI